MHLFICPYNKQNYLNMHKNILHTNQYKEMNKNAKKSKIYKI